MTIFEKMENKTSNRKKVDVHKIRQINPNIWGDMVYDEKQAYRLYEAFQKHTNKRGVKMKWLPSVYKKNAPNEERDEMRPADPIRSSKNWKYFVECWELYVEDENFDINNFMDSIFRNMTSIEKIFPTQLRTKKIKQQYLDYRMKLKMTKVISTEKKMLEDLATSFRYIRNRIGDCEYSTLWEWFNNPKDGMYLADGMVCAIQEMISPFYYTISKSFIKAYYNSDKDIQEEIISSKDFAHIQSLVKIKSPVYNFAKKIFGNDII